MKKRIPIFLILTISLLFSACGEPEPQETAASTVPSSGETETVPASETVTGAEPDAALAPETDPEGTFRLKAPTVDEARTIVLDYFKEMASVEWVCKSDMDYSSQKSYTSKLIYKAGETYYGLPYVSKRGFTEKFEFYLDGDGVYTGPTSYDSCVGNSCASSTRVAFDTVSTKVTFSGTYNSFPWANTGMVAVGGYSWEGIDVSDLQKVLSSDVVKKDRETIYEAYAQTLPGDIITQRHLSGSSVIGHTRMVSSEPVVKRANGGKILPSRSYLITREQNSSFYANSSVKTTWRIDVRYTFDVLAGDGYLPMRLEEFETGEIPDAIIRTEDLSPDDSLFSAGAKAFGKIESNYPILRAKAILTDAEGNVVSSAALFPSPNKTANLAGCSFNADLSSLPKGEYVYSVTVKVGFGEVTCLQETVRN